MGSCIINRYDDQSGQSAQIFVAVSESSTDLPGEELFLFPVEFELLHPPEVALLIDALLEEYLDDVSIVDVLGD